MPGPKRGSSSSQTRSSRSSFSVEPITDEFFRLGEGREDPWSYAPGQLELLEGAKDKAKAEGLWNFFLPDAETGEGLANLDYAYIAMELGKNPIASECLNCSAPDTGNMEVLARYGTPEQQERWLTPLLAGETRSSFAMTEPAVASSDATNIETSIVRDGDEYVVNGSKIWSSGAHHSKLGILIALFRARATGGQLTLNSEVTEFGWFGPDHLPEDIIPQHVRRIHDAAREPQTVIFA